MTVSLIVAVASNGAIGKDNDLLWRLPRDMKYFRDTTLNHCVIMGRRNYNSIPHTFRPLTDRTNIVVTRNPDFTADNCVICHSVEEGIEYARQSGDDEAFVIGGGQIYEYALANNLCDRLYITEVHEDFEADVFFPKIDLSNWVETSREAIPTDERHAYAFDFVVYERKS